MWMIENKQKPWLKHKYYKHEWKMADDTKTWYKTSIKIERQTRCKNQTIINIIKHRKLKDEQHHGPIKNQGWTVCTGSVNSSCLVTTSVLLRVMVKDQITKQKFLKIKKKYYTRNSSKIQSTSQTALKRILYNVSSNNMMIMESQCRVTSVYFIDDVKQYKNNPTTILVTFY